MYGLVLLIFFKKEFKSRKRTNIFYEFTCAAEYYNIIHLFNCFEYLSGLGITLLNDYLTTIVRENHSNIYSNSFINLI